MSKGKKYSFKIEQVESHWRAQITRQVTSQKVVVTKEKGGFESETDATQWAEKELLEFTKTLASSNTRHGEQRKESEEIQRLRSSRRADKTKQAKDEKAKDIDANLDDAVTGEIDENSLDEADD